MANGRISDIQRMTEAGVDLVFNRAAKMPKKMYYPQIVTEKQQVKKIGNYDSIGDLSAAQEKIEGDTYVFDSIEENNRTTIESKTYGKGVFATMEKLDYDLENVVKNTFGNPLIKKLLQLKERKVADAYNDSFATTGADGVYILSASHPLQRSASLNDNLATGALTPDNFIAGKNKFNFIYDQAGEFYDTEPTHLLIHPAKMWLALQIIQSNLMAFELSNTKNVTNEVMPIKIITNRYLDYNASTGVSPWFLLDKTIDDAGCILQTKRGLKLKTWWVNENEIYRGTASEMYGVGFISPSYGIVGSTGA